LRVLFFLTLIALKKKGEESSTDSAAHANKYSNMKDEMTLPK
jgi:hypothetical protein